MCVVSMIVDHYREKWTPFTIPESPPLQQPQMTEEEWRKLLELYAAPKPPAITKEEIEEFRRLLERAREYDRRNNEPNCELQEKRDALLVIAKQLGVDIAFL